MAEMTGSAPAPDPPKPEVIFGVSVPLTDGRVIEVAAYERGEVNLAIRQDPDDQPVSFLTLINEDARNVSDSMILVTQKNGPVAENADPELPPKE